MSVEPARPNPFEPPGDGLEADLERETLPTAWAHLMAWVTGLAGLLMVVGALVGVGVFNYRMVFVGPTAFGPRAPRILPALVLWALGGVLWLVAAQSWRRGRASRASLLDLFGMFYLAGAWWVIEG